MVDLTKGKEWKVILLFALPMLIGNVFQQAYSIIDSIVVGRYLGTDALAATGTTFPIFFLLISLAIGVGSGNSVIISQYFGAKRMEDVKRAIGTQFIFMLLMSLIIMAVGLIFCRPLMHLMGVPPEVFEMSCLYFTTMIYGTIFMFGYNTISSILRGLGDSTTILYFVVISTIINIVLDILFIAYLHWGVEAAAWATVISQGVAFFSAMVYLNIKHDIISFKLSDLVFDTKIFIKSIRIGLPTGVQQITVSLGMLAIWRFVNDFGADTMAGYTAAVRINGIATMPSMLIGVALTSFVGQNIGANQYERVQSGFKSTVVMSVILSLLITSVIYLFPHFFVGMFMKESEASSLVMETGVNYLLIVSPFYFLFSVMFASHGLLRGAGDTLIPMFISILSLWLLRIPLAYQLSQTELKADGIWWSIPIAWAVGMTASLIYYKVGRWKRIKAIS